MSSKSEAEHVGAAAGPSGPAPAAPTTLLAPPAVELKSVTVAFRSGGELVHALSNVDLQIGAGEFVALVGPSGCGKTTILNLLAGLMKPTKGTLERHGTAVDGPADDIGYMLARSALTPWRSARRNVELGLELRGVSRSQRRARAMELLGQMRIDQFANAYPSQLSHGMQQRVAIARTLAIQPDLWLMDEPFGALDAQTRVTVQSEFLGLWDGSGKTVVFVTHDLNEAVLLADRVIVMSPRPGRITLDRKIGLSRPRDLRELRFDEEFMATERQIWEELHHAVI